MGIGVGAGMFGRRVMASQPDVEMESTENPKATAIVMPPPSEEHVEVSTTISENQNNILFLS